MPTCGNMWNFGNIAAVESAGDVPDQALTVWLAWGEACI